MRISFLIVLLLTLVGAGAFWYQTTASECPAPLAYRLGEIDPSFDLSSVEALRYLAEAEAVWESEVDRELFEYSESARLTVDFVFDERQASADAEVSQRKILDEKWSENEQVFNTVSLLQEQYSSLSQLYEKRVADYDKKLNEYNIEVGRYNDRGGAPEAVFEKLESARVELNNESGELSVFMGELNSLAANINRLNEKGGELVGDYNEDVYKYNHEFGSSEEFTQGDYQGTKIHVYKFSSEEEVVKVLAHEFGHALGMSEHVEGTSSLMYYLLEDTDEMPKLSMFDLQAFQLVCGMEESVEQRVRRVIRDLLNSLNK